MSSDRFIKDLGRAFELAMLQHIRVLDRHDPPYQTFKPRSIKDTPLGNDENGCWCLDTLADEDRHSAWHCPNRPRWRLGLNFRFRPCNHKPERTPICGKCVDFTLLAKQYAVYASNETFNLEEVGVDVAAVDRMMFEFAGMRDAEALPLQGQMFYAECAAVVARLAVLVKDEERCRFASHLTTEPDACLVHAVTNWGELRFSRCVEHLFDKLKVVQRQR
ncbi:hypothetical protein LIA77_02220 [Sarocladium implicatum]|nr:hypothetical protein LIA77_02220 [Sarocladium implicatum]